MEERVEHLEKQNEVLVASRKKSLQAAFQKKIINVMRHENVQIKQHNQIMEQATGMASSLESHGYF